MSIVENRGLRRTGCALVVALAGPLALAAPPDAPSAGEAAVQPREPSIEESIRVARSLSKAFNHAAETIEPSVVHITQLSRVAVRRSFFEPAETQLAPTGMGSGVIVTGDGYVLTNNHVIDGAERVQVKLMDGRELDGRVVGADPATDLGVVKIDAANLTPARFGDSDKLDVGEWVLAVGSPFGEFDNTVTAGIISAKGRTGLRPGNASDTGLGRDERFEDFVQTDAAINPGNSGGPLVNLDGQVVGINSQIASRSGGSVGIGFSIPTGIARPVMDMIINKGRVERGWLGITMSQWRSGDGGAVGGNSGAGRAGVIVENVVPGGPASRAGFQKGDVIVKFNGHPTDTVNHLKNLIAFTPPGTDASIDVLRDGKPLALSTTLVDTTEGRSMLPGGKGLPRFGLTVQTLPPKAIPQLNTEAVIINSLDQLGPAAEAGLLIDDVILRVQGNAVGTAEEFDSAVQAVKRDRVRLDIYRPRTNQTGYVTVSARE
jgi:serine protease Do